MRSETSALTTAVNAVPITTATARSTTLPRIRNFLKSVSSFGTGWRLDSSHGSADPSANGDPADICVTSAPNSGSRTRRPPRRARELRRKSLRSGSRSAWSRDGSSRRLPPPRASRAYTRSGHRAPSVEADLTAAVLYAGPGAMLSHATALWWRGLIDRQPWPIEVSTPRRCRSLHGVRVYGRRNCGRVWHKDLPVTTIEQALLDFAARAPLERVRYALSVADYLQVLDVPALQVTAGTGRAGSTKLRKALERHEPKLATHPQPARASIPAAVRVLRDPAPGRCQRPDRGRPGRRGVVGAEVGGRARRARQPQLVGADPARPQQRAPLASGRIRRASATARSSWRSRRRWWPAT